MAQSASSSAARVMAVLLSIGALRFHASSRAGSRQPENSGPFSPQAVTAELAANLALASERFGPLYRADNKARDPLAIHLDRIGMIPISAIVSPETIVFALLFESWNWNRRCGRGALFVTSRIQLVFDVVEFAPRPRTAFRQLGADVSVPPVPNGRQTAPS